MTPPVADMRSLPAVRPQEITRYYYKSTSFQILVAMLIVAVMPLALQARYSVPFMVP